MMMVVLFLNVIFIFVLLNDDVSSYELTTAVKEEEYYNDGIMVCPRGPVHWMMILAAADSWLPYGYHYWFCEILGLALLPFKLQNVTLTSKNYI